MRPITAALLLLAAALVVAWESPPPPVASPGQAPPRAPQATAETEPAKKPAEPVKLFVPSEKISADSAVAFPVDI